MNFQRIAPPPTPKELLDLSFSRAVQKSKEKKLKGEWLEKIKKKEAIKLDVAVATLITKIRKTDEQFPNLEEIPIFYEELAKLTFDTRAYKRSQKSLSWAVEQIKKVQKSVAPRIFRAQTRDAVKSPNKEFFGRASSIINALEEPLAFLTKTRRIMRTYPDIKDIPTICLYGFPNVGKSTLLNLLTQTKAKTAAYAFTTKTINAGYFMQADEKIQVLDVPGTLARKDKMNTIEKQAQLVLEEVADVVVYVFDLSDTCGYPIEDQVKLYNQVKKLKKTYIYLSKKDLISKEMIDNFPLKHLTQEEIHLIKV